jgi:transcriptional regulator with XRE-family HTH domain
MVVGKAETQELREQIGRQLRQARLGAGTSQVELAAEIGMASTYLSEVETGKHNITLDTLAGIASFLGLPSRGDSEVLETLADNVMTAAKGAHNLVSFQLLGLSDRR